MPIGRKADAGINVTGNQLRSSSENRHLIKEADTRTRLFDAIEENVIAIRRESEPCVLSFHRSQYLGIAASGYCAYPQALLAGLRRHVDDVLAIGRDRRH